ncbi:MAG: sodium/proton antiporter NhaB [Succinivibrionaceae bacterium]
MNSKQVSPMRALARNFMGDAPNWYKQLIILFLVLNPILFQINPFVCGWLLVGEFILTLAMALKCYPLLPGGLLAIESLFIGMTTTNQVKLEIEHNLEVILLLMFMVAGIHFIRHLLLLVFTKILIKIRSKIAISLIFCFMAAFLSAFLDALTVLAVIITVCSGFYAVYHHYISSPNTPLNDNSSITGEKRKDLDNLRTFLRSILMHSAVGTALGGICTIVGEPQNLIIGEQAGWHFAEFALRVSPVSLPVFIFGLLTCYVVEKFHIGGYGVELPENVYKILKDEDEKKSKNFTMQDKMSLIFQTIVALWLIVGLAFHLAAVGLIGLSVIVLATSFTGVNSEGEIGKAFTESLPFTSLLCVFFTIVAVIMDQHLFDPIISAVLSVSPEQQLPLFYVANGILSMVSDNVFVATVYINQVKQALVSGNISLEQFNHLAIAINAGTNLPSVATPNGQAAFLFLLTSAIAPLIRLSYGRMLVMAIPYTIVLSVVGLICTWYVLPPITDWFITQGFIAPHDVATVVQESISSH